MFEIKETQIVLALKPVGANSQSQEIRHSPESKKLFI
jgi:hypothetical protein